ncbi:DUF2459 domain-containing protein [Marinimicrobium alkaliphilum]|uniref:DUF2459 domain-containing protein n=1 Tax=Marinimicrobium alkaliphilum TaxID=2202654 RepID=UPI000DB90056|nr:DUF2459 domain-containing protein [Marinimicrobium alkaliphilum]
MMLQGVNRWVALGLTLMLLGCTGVVTCPEAVEAPRAVYLVKHGWHHPTLVVTDAGGDLLRYGYGDWRYYAEAETGFWSGTRALVWPSAATLGRQHYRAGGEGPEPVHRAVRAGISEIYAFTVAGPKVDALIAALDQQFEDGQAQREQLNRPYDFIFVAHSDAYWMGHNSNHRVARWLESLGCEARRARGVVVALEGGD